MIRTFARIILATLAALIALSHYSIAACKGESLLPILAPTPDAVRDLRSAAAAYPNAKGVFWRVERPGILPSHLFGTYHATDPEVATPPKAIAAAIRSSRLLFVEITPEEMGRMHTALQSNTARIMETSGAVLDDFLSPRQREKAERILQEYGTPWSVARRLRPWFVQIQLAQPPCEAAAIASGGKLLDMQLVDLARGVGVETRGLETWNVAIELFEGQSIADQRRSLMLALDMAGQTENLHRTALELYLAGEVMMIWEIGRVATRRLAGDDGGHLARMEDEFWRRAVVQRNRNFIAAAHAELAEGGVVIAVGALHLPGRDGLVELLRADGYQVTRQD